MWIEDSSSNLSPILNSVYENIIMMENVGAPFSIFSLLFHLCDPVHFVGNLWSFEALRREWKPNQEIRGENWGSRETWKTKLHVTPLETFNLKKKADRSRREQVEDFSSCVNLTYRNKSSLIMTKHIFLCNSTGFLLFSLHCNECTFDNRDPQMLLLFYLYKNSNTDTPCNMSTLFLLDVSLVL